MLMLEIKKEQICISIILKLIRRSSEILFNSPFLTVEGKFIFFIHYTPVAWNIVLCIIAFINIVLHGILININIPPLAAKDFDLGRIFIVYEVHFSAYFSGQH